ncbi:FAD-dependent oxidoreductase [Psychrosphaera haliotis]|uniref:NAD(P)/FAD-dependent oxidoreductase n=1 Tax=Psychrosphaera haliotis TaxID=555083 RepID=UPI0031E2325D
MKVAIVGAGLTGAVIADELSSKGYDITVIEKSRGRGGRMNTKRLSWGNCDMGAQYFTARDSRFVSAVEKWEMKGLVSPWTLEPQLLREKTLATSPDAELRYVATPEMNSIAKQLLNDKKVELNTKINHITFDDGKWLLWRDNMELVGVFDWLISTIPAEQARELFNDLPDISKQIPSDVHDPCWAVTLATKGSVNPVLQGVFSKEKVSWLAKQSHKPAREITENQKSQQIEDIWNIHFSAEYTKQNIGENANVIKQEALNWLNELIVNNNLGEPVTLIDSYVHYWRYARPTESYLEKYKADDSNVIFNDKEQFAIIGEWAKGGRVEGAYLSAIECAGKMHNLD